MKRCGFALAAALAVLAGGAWAEDRAVIVANQDYDHAPAVEKARLALELAERMKARGYRVVQGVDLNAADLRSALADLLRDDPAPGPRVIMLSGNFAQSASDTWFLGVDAEKPDLTGADRMGVPLSVVMDLLGRAPGKSILLLAHEARDVPVGAGLTPGVGALTVPEGVTVIQGDPTQIARAAEMLLKPDQRISGLNAAGKSIRLSGYTDGPALLGAATGTVETHPAAPAQKGEELAWRGAQSLNSVEGYDSFLRDFPDGRFAAQARAQRDSLRSDNPEDRAKATEEALNLSRDRRRQIQRHLVLLGYETKGIDGLFGPATRAAVTRWQKDRELPATGYLIAPQLERLDQEAGRRAAQLEKEAKEREEIARQQDEAYWAQTGKDGGEGALLAYLDRYPEGLHAEEAQARLDRLRADRITPAERDAWAQAEKSGNYGPYLRDYPKGNYAEAARQRQKQQQEAANSQYAQQETALGLTPVTRQLVESRLAGLGLNTGKVDGVFDADTRRALRQYQKARNLPATGFMNQNTVVRLLADTFLQ